MLDMFTLMILINKQHDLFQSCHDLHLRLNFQNDLFKLKINRGHLTHLAERSMMLAKRMSCLFAVRTEKLLHFFKIKTAIRSLEA